MISKKRHFYISVTHLSISVSDDYAGFFHLKGKQKGRQILRRFTPLDDEKGGLGSSIITDHDFSSNGCLTIHHSINPQNVKTGNILRSIVPPFSEHAQKPRIPDSYGFDTLYTKILPF